MTLISVTYCTEADLQRRFSPSTVTSWSEQEGDGMEYPGTVDDFINQASQEIEAYARQWYSQAGLSSCPLINRWCVILAAYFGYSSRGNPVPDSVQKQYDKIMDRLNDLMDGLFRLPGIPMSFDMSPTWSNLRVDRRYIQQKLRVQEQISSTAPTALSQNIDDEIPAGFL